MTTGEPSRRPRRAKADVRDLAQRYTRLAVETLAEVARTSDKEAARVAAANALLERGWGRSTPATGGGEPVRIEVVTGIDRTPAATLEVHGPASAAPDWPETAEDSVAGG